MIRYTKREEIWNSASHGGGILLGVVIGIIFLVWAFRGDNDWARVGVILYLVGMLGSYIASTLYHAMKHHSPWKERLRRWDHAAIYWHIAGSYSPLTLVALREQGYWGWGLFTFVWACAIAGTIVSFIRLKEHSNLETLCFIGMGLSVLVAFKPLLDSVSTAAVVWIVAEGVCYITGALFYSLNKRKYMHSVFHFFVLAGSVCHIVAVWDVLMEYVQEKPAYHSILPEGLQLREGDVVFRRGGGMVSHVVVAADREGNYSHVGIVVDSAGVPMVVHAVPGEPDFEGDPDRVKMDRPEHFFSSQYTSIGEVCRAKDSAAARQAAQVAMAVYRRHTLFDHDYDDHDTVRMYCTELIVHAYARAGLPLVGSARHEVRLPMLTADCIFPSDIKDSRQLESLITF